MGRECLFGEVLGGRMRLNAQGELVKQVWEELPHHYVGVALDAFVVMPNHIHGLVALEAPVGAGLRPAQPLRDDQSPGEGLPEVMRAFKSFSARRINESRDNPGAAVWQRGYFDHIVRDRSSLVTLRYYIKANPSNWAEDEENPGRIGMIEC